MEFPRREELIYTSMPRDDNSIGIRMGLRRKSVSGLFYQAKTREVTIPQNHWKACGNTPGSF